MMRTATSVLAAGLTTAVLLMGAERALACTCAPGGKREAFRDSDAAIVARLMEDGVELSDPPPYSYRVLRVYKGRRKDLDEGEVLNVRGTTATDGSEDTCAAPTTEGRRYGLFLDGPRAQWKTSLCQVITPKAMQRVARGQSAGSAGGRNCG